jgi:hypothetical protein
MAIRVPVVISVSRNSKGLSADDAADLAAKLLLEKDGCEVNVIGSIETMDHQSTDCLFLDGLPRDVLLLTGEPLDMIRQRLAELGLSSPDSRRFEIWHISQGDSSSAIVGRVLQYIKDRRTQVVQIGILGLGKLRPKPPPPTDIACPAPLPQAQINEQFLNGLVDRLGDMDL